MLLYENEVLDSIIVEGTINVHKDSFKRTVQYYVRDQNEQRTKYNKEVRKQIMVEFRDLIIEDNPEFKLAAYSEIGDGSFISFSEDQAIKVPREQEEEVNLNDSNETCEIHDSDLSNSNPDSDNYKKLMINFIDTSIQ